MSNFFSKFDVLIKNALIHTMNSENSVIKNSAIGIVGDKIAWIGAHAANNIPADLELDAQGNLVTPGLIDCHTHLVYAGNRACEFEMRLEGLTYVDIAKKGGGIQSTVNATHATTIEQLYQQSSQRLQTMMSYGVTTVEIKSGYGLDLETEVKILNVAKRLGEDFSIRVHPTYLALHTTPVAFKKNIDGYVEHVISTILPYIVKNKLATQVDAYCETIAFSLEHVKRLFQAAKQCGLGFKLHAEQLTNMGGAVLAADLGADSIDHLEYLTSNDCQKINNGKTIAVLLPGAFYFLREKQVPPIDALRQNHIPIAIASDCNPGTSPFLSLPLIMNLACVLFGLTIDEAWWGVTKHAAKALQCDDLIGSIEIGKVADLVLWNCRSLSEIIYHPTFNYCDQVIFSGKLR